MDLHQNLQEIPKDELIELYLKTSDHRDILAEALAEIMATHKGKSDQSIQDILDGCIEEVAELHKPDRIV